MCRGTARWTGLSVIAWRVVTALATACSTPADSRESRGDNGGTVGSAGGAPNQDAVGSVGLRLAIGTGVDVNSLEWTIANTSIAYSGTVFITDDAGVSAQSVEFVAGGIVAGSYTVSIDGSDSNGDPCFGSTAPDAVVVTAGTTTAATVLVTCTLRTDASFAATVVSGSVAIDAGVALVNQGPYECPGISSFAISPAELLPPQTAALSGVSTTGFSAGTETFLWTTSCAGALIQYPASPNAAFDCSLASGTCVVTLTINLDGVSVGGGDAGLVCPGTAGAPYYEQMSANVVCEALDSSVQGSGPEVDAGAGVEAGPCPARNATGTGAFAYQIDPAHDGYQPNDELTLPLCQRWQATFPAGLSYAVIAAGRVFVTVGTPGSSLYALDESSGATLWGPIDLGSSLPPTNLAYDQGQVFAVTAYGDLMAFDAASGANEWSTSLNFAGAPFEGPPTAFMGTVYVNGGHDESDGFVSAVDETTGALLWSTAVQNEGVGTPAISVNGVYVSGGLNQTYAFDPGSGALLWQFNPSEDYGANSGLTPALFGGAVYIRNFPGGNLILDALSGMNLGSYTASLIPAFGAQQTFRVNDGAMSAFSLASGAVAWTFGGDGQLATPPIVVGSNVVVGSSSGALFVLDAATGSIVSSVNVGAPIEATDEFFYGTPLGGLSEADGLLVVPVGATLFAY